VSSGSGDFAVGGDLAVTGTAQAAALSVSGNAHAASLTIDGDATVTGNTTIGWYVKSCYYNDPPDAQHPQGPNGHCYCNGNDRALSGGFDCDYNNATYAAVYSEASGSHWYAMCDNTDVAGDNFVVPVEIAVTCARVR
jgi:hypothetical protein